MKLFQEWLDYERGKREGMVRFIGDEEVPVDILQGRGAKILLLVEKLSGRGEELAEPVVRRLVEAGFHPPDELNPAGYYRESPTSDSGELAGVIETVFREMIGAGEDFTAQAEEVQLG